MSDSALCQQVSPGVWKLLTVMKDDDITATVRSDFCILQLAQSFFNKHGQDPTKYDYIRQKLREIGRLLLTLRKDFSIHTLEDAVRPVNFQVVIQAVKKVSGFDDEKHCYQTPSLALKLGHSLQKISDIVHCRALMAEDNKLELTDVEQSEESEVEKENPPTHPETDNVADAIKAGTSEGPAAPNNDPPELQSTYIEIYPLQVLGPSDN
ncbi:uncharacterized protein V6R79_006093 [Siganus canaliculatus]